MKVSIIGAGISGLTIGCYLQMNGFETTIFEKHNASGGLCTAWKRGDYTFDGCIHWLFGSNSSNPFYKLGKTVILRNTLYVRDPTTNLYAFDIQTGKYSVALKIQANWPSMDSLRDPIGASSLLVIPFGDDRLFAYFP